MANFSCDAFLTINAAIAQADMGQLNITTYVGACPEICTLAWGTGNPDLSGIGANISYILQAVLTFIFGPIFCLAYAFRDGWTRKIDSEKARGKELELLQTTFLDISAQFSIPVAVAAVIRFSQHAPYYELAFLRSLTSMQFLSILSSAVTSGIFERRISTMRIAIFVAYGLIEFALYVGLLGALRTSRASWQTLSDLAEACQGYKSLLPWLPHIPAPVDHIPDATFKQHLNPFNKKAWEDELLTTVLVITGFLALMVLAVLLFGIFVALISKNAVVLGTISTGLSIGMFVELGHMEKTRNVMKAVTGAEFQDNQWGFGQVIAIFLWAPLCFQSVYTILSISFGDPEFEVKTGQRKQEYVTLKGENEDEIREEKKIGVQGDTQTNETTQTLSEKMESDITAVEELLLYD